MDRLSATLTAFVQVGLVIVVFSGVVAAIAPTLA